MSSKAKLCLSACKISSTGITDFPENKPTIKPYLEELKNGKKETHWMWYVFPQLKALGVSERALAFGVESTKEAKEMLDYDPFAQHLKLCTRLVLQHSMQFGREEILVDIFGEVDAMKFISCMTLFALVSKESSRTIFDEALIQFNEGLMCVETVKLVHKELIMHGGSD